MSHEEREVQGYYQPWLAAHGSSPTVADKIGSLATHDLERQGYQALQSRDRTLTAFAQLVTLRLDVRRCMISLIDPTHQYILAEATRPDTTTNVSEALWLGNAVLNRPDAVCGHCLTNTCFGLEDNGERYTTAGLVVPDCHADERFQEREYVTREPGVRFYAGVPLHSPTGHVIGACSVSDEKPRETLSAALLRVLEDTARSVMEHLEWARDRVDRFRGERIVRGMASFIEECSPACEPGSPNEAEKHPCGENPTRRPPIPKRMTSGKALRQFSENEDGPTARVFATAADILRESTMADGIVIFGASSGVGNAVFTAASSTSDMQDDSGSDSEEPPSAPCKVLAVSIGEDTAVPSPERPISLSLSTLENYFSLYPSGNVFSIDDDSSSHAGNGGRNGGRARKRRRSIDPKDLVEEVPAVKTLVFLPVYDHGEEKLIAGCFLWTTFSGRMMDLDGDMSYLRAFGNCIASELLRRNIQKNEAAKTTFIASMSHELRSPLHGILGATEFLVDTVTDTYQSTLLHSIVTCGKTLLETLNHVLDYSKINKLGRTRMKKNAGESRAISLPSDSTMDSINETADFDLAILVEEVAEAVTSGHTFKQNPFTGSVDAPADASSSSENSQRQGEHPVQVLLDIIPRHSWMVRMQPGALRRIIMNVYGNALKHTPDGFVAISLRAKDSQDGSKLNVLIRIVDSGTGISEKFQREKLFVPFSQEDSFQPGTGLGLSIVKQIVDSLGGYMEVKSQKGLGTEIDIHLSLTPADPSKARGLEQEVSNVEQKFKGRKLLLVDHLGGSVQPRPPTDRIARLHTNLSEVCSTWFGLDVVRTEHVDRTEAVVLICSEPPAVAQVVTWQQQHQLPRDESNKLPPILIVYNHSAAAVSLARKQQKSLEQSGRIVEMVPQPCGPRKLARVFNRCLKRLEDTRGGPMDDVLNSPTEGAREQTKSPNSHSPTGEPVGNPEDLGSTMSTAIAYPTSPTTVETASSSGGHNTSDDQDRTKPHVLLVDDNKINRQLLVMFMKKSTFTYVEAENGQEAVDAYKASCSPTPASGLVKSQRFDFVLMDISMPVMDGMEATRQIRQLESAQSGGPRAKIIALTGLADGQARSDAEEAGVDLFLPKPVKFADLKKLLTEEKEGTESVR